MTPKSARKIYGFDNCCPLSFATRMPRLGGRTNFLLPKQPLISIFDLVCYTLHMQSYMLKMQRVLGKPFLRLLIQLLLHIHAYRCCIEEERRGLIEIKAFLKSNNENANRLLPSWVEDEMSDCCGWERVGCDPSTGHVTELSLNDLRKNARLEMFRGYNEGHWQLYYEDDKFWLLNVSLFLSFKELRSLDLAANSFDGWTGDEGFERLSSSKLETLNISANEFNKTIMKSLGAITSIKTLALSKINLDGSYHIQELAKLKHLEMLDMSDNLLGGSPSMQGFQRLFILKNLTMLDLNNNLLHQDDLSFLSALKSLETLSLRSNRLGPHFPINELSALENLKMLDLSLTGLGYSLTLQGSQLLSRLKKLETLDLSFNYQLSNAIIRQLSALKSLKNLILSDYNYEGPFPAQELSVLENLVMLDLSANGFSGSLTMQDSKSLLKLSKLEHLDLSLNNFDMDILKTLGSLPALKSLSLARNHMEGMLSDQDFKTFSNLEKLELWANNFTGTVPPSIWKLSSLKSLSLAQNNLSGPIQGMCELKNLEELDLSQNTFEGVLPSCLHNLTSLRLLDLSHNRFKGSFSFSSLANHSKLEVVSLASDNNKFEVETEYPNWVPMFQLKILVLSKCNLNKFTGSIPKFLQSQSKLVVLDLSHNNLKGRFPSWLLENNSGLKILKLRNNSLMGQIHVTPYPNINFLWMDVSDNQLDGKFQENLAEMVPHLNHLNLSNNVLEGDIPSSIGEMMHLYQLDLSSNHFSGELPKELVSGCISLLYVLKLSNNKFHGQLFSRHFNLSLLSLHADNNEFTGTLSDVISRSPKLSLLDVSNNYMSGEIPSWIGNMTSLRTLVLHNNFFRGQFPCELVLSGFFDVSYNALSGSLPSCNNLQHLEHVHLQGNRLTGSLPDNFLNSSSLLTLDIRYNNLSGSIPDSIAALPNLRILLLRGNHLSGFIPEQFCLLTKISLMDLSKNSFSGSIPTCFHLINFGEIEENSHVFAQGIAYPSYGLTVYVDNDYKKASYSILEDEGYDEQVEVEFITKNRPSSYKGDILNFMSGLDLSLNNLSGEIPYELGKLSSIHALNLSHNWLTGSIPKSFSNLAQLESLDLSYNNLSGEIPSELIGLNFLAVFSVAYNNLTGRTPDMKAQFGTFGETSYDGNPLLCGPLLKRKCNSIVEPPYSSPTSSNESEWKWYENGPVVFSASFAGAYIVILLGFAAVLYINPYWRRRWFNFIEECIYSCYDFASDLFYKLSARLYT